MVYVFGTAHVFLLRQGPSPGSAGAGWPVIAGHVVIGHEAEPASGLGSGEQVKPRRNARQFFVLGLAAGAAIQVRPHGGCLLGRTCQPRSRADAIVSVTAVRRRSHVPPMA
jgi:hypothetical protein